MNISNYTSYFHDGSIINIEHSNSNVVISMDSAELAPQEIVDDVILSDRKTIKGKLHIEDVLSITEDGNLSIDKLTMLYDSAEVLHFEMTKNTVYLDLEWTNYPPNPDITEYSFYNIKAQRIWWENIPDLYDPFLVACKPENYLHPLSVSRYSYLILCFFEGPDTSQLSSRLFSELNLRDAE